MRLVLALLAGMVLASTAYAQSDDRWVGILYSDGTGTTSPHRTSGNLGLQQMSESNHAMQIALERMGVPYRIITLADSANWWKVLGENGPLSTNNPGVADSTRFRRAKCMGLICTMNTYGSSNQMDMQLYFQAPGMRGKQAAAPTGGTWSIPCLFFSYGSVNISGFNNGTGYAYAGYGNVNFNYHKGTFANGDSIVISDSDIWKLASGQTDSVTVIMYGETGKTTAAAGDTVKAWRWKNNAYWYPLGGSNLKAVQILLGLADFFRAAGYVPRQKLNLHWTWDHPYPENTYNTAELDSFWVYELRNGWRQSMMVKADTAQRPSALMPVRAHMSAMLRALKAPHVPHSHNDLFGNYFGSQWDHATFADTATIRARWQMMETCIADTMDLPPARGYEKTIGYPGDGVYFPYLYIFSGLGYTDVRVAQSDSAGLWPASNTGRNYRRVWAGPVTQPNSTAWPSLPFRYILPSTGKSVWIHDLKSYPVDVDSTLSWSNIAAGLNSKTTIWAYSGKYIAYAADAILYDTDLYWHPATALRPPASGAASTDMPMAVLSRHLTYFLSRLSNIATVEPSYRPKYPRRSSVARP